MSEPFVMDVQLRCPVEHAFEAFTGMIDLWWPRSHRKFADSVLRLEPKLGGRFLEETANGESMTFGEVLRCDPPNEICLT
ncbi:MAG: hypothetical protein GKR98_16020 [Boseongicola sp.]|nr:MAG: hypothetical protein GKR98_16020 [Boseongicola sp.]